MHTYVHAYFVGGSFSKCQDG